MLHKRSHLEGAVKIGLKCKVRVRTLEVAAIVAVSRNQPEYLAVAQLAESMGEVDGPLLCRELLGNLPKEIGWKVLEQALYLGLLERTKEKGPARLSELGKAALQQGQILVPEEKIWRFYLVNDPLIECGLLHVEPIAPKDNTQGEKSNRGNDFAQLRSICVQNRDGLVCSVIDGLAFSLKNILANDGNVGITGEIELVLECDLNNSKRMYLKGTLPNGKTNSSHGIEKGEMSLPPTLETRTHRSLWIELAKQFKELYETEKNALDGLANTDVPLNLRIFTRPRPANKEAMDKLAKAGAKIYAHDKLHAKAVLSETEGLVMTANLAKHGLDEGFEVGIVLDKKTQQTLKSTFEEWEQEFPWEYRPEGNRNQKEEGEICFAEKSLRDGRRQLLLENIVRLPPMESPPPEKQQTTEPNESIFKPHLRDTDKECYHRICFEWEVLPPKAQTDPSTKEKKKKQAKGKA